MADKTIGELPSLSTMEDDTLIPVEHDGEAKSMAGSVMQSYVYDLVQDDVETISEIIAVGPKGEDGADGADGVSPTLSSSKSGKTTTVYYTDANHPTSTVLATLQDGADGSGIGDMLKSTYDTDDDGIVDDSEKLGGYAASHYATITDGRLTARYGIPIYDTAYFDTTLTDAYNGKIVIVPGDPITITIPSGLTWPFRIWVLNESTGAVTIAPASGIKINGASSSVVLSNKYDMAWVYQYGGSVFYVKVI